MSGNLAVMLGPQLTDSGRPELATAIHRSISRAHENGLISMHASDIRALLGEIVRLSAPERIDGLRGTAERVAAAKTEGDEARAAIDAAEAELLERVVEAIRPALPALCSNVEGFDWRGMVVLDCPIRTTHPDEPSGYERLYLDADGWWRELSDRNVGRVSELVLSHRAVVENWHVPDVIERIASALESHDNGNAASTAEKMRERAERIRAVATLLGGK